MVEQGPEEPRVVSSILTRGTMKIMNRFVTYFTNLNTPSDSKLVMVGMILSLLLIVSGILLPVARRRTTNQLFWLRLVAAWSKIFWISGLVWFLLFFLRYELIYPLTMRLWVYLVLLPVIAALVVVYRQQTKIKPQLAKQRTLHDHYEKYLPQPKRTR